MDKCSRPKRSKKKASCSKRCLFFKKRTSPAQQSTLNQNPRVFGPGCVGFSCLFANTAQPLPHDDWPPKLSIDTAAWRCSRLIRREVARMTACNTRANSLQDSAKCDKTRKRLGAFTCSFFQIVRYAILTFTLHLMASHAPVTICVAGGTNSGKSSLINRMLGANAVSLGSAPLVEVTCFWCSSFSFVCVN